jgi:hypothetical protein
MGAFEEELALGRELWTELIAADSEADLIFRLHDLAEDGLRAALMERALRTYRGSVVTEHVRELAVTLAAPPRRRGH